MITHPLLLQLDWSTIGSAIGWLVGGLTLAERVYTWVFGGTGKRLDKLEASVGQFVDKDALEKRFGEIENRAALVAKDVLNQHNTLHEYERKRTELTGEFRGRIGVVEDKVHALETMPNRVTSLETKLDNLVVQITDLKEGQRTLKQELREDMRGNKGEILAAIKELKPHP